MDESQDTRRSGRRRVRPVEFWNFEKPEEAESDTIIYNVEELTRHSIFKPFSLSYRGLPQTNSNRVQTRVKSPVESHSTHIPKPRGRKRKLENKESSEKAVPHPVVSVAEPPQSPRLRRRKGSEGGQETVKKQKLVEKERCEGDDGYSTLNEDPMCTPRIDRRRRTTHDKESEKQKKDDRTAGEEQTHENTNNRIDEASVIHPSKNQSNPPSSFFNESEVQRTTNTTKPGRFNITPNNNNTTAFEPPSFCNVLSSTVIDAPRKALFKIPRLPPLRKPLSMLKVSSQCLDPSMVTIPEEREERQEEGKGEKEQQDKGKQGEGEEGREEQVKAPSQLGQEKAGDGGGTAATSTKSPRKRGRPKKSPAVRVTTEEGHEQGTGQQGGQEDTLTQALNRRRSSRVRTKPLEFWNFERVEVERQDGGEVKVIHQKQDASQLIQTRVMDCTNAVHSQTGKGITILDDLLRNPTETTTTTTTSTTTSTQTIPQKSLKTTRKSGVHPGLSPSQSKRKVNARRIISSWSAKRTSSKSPIKRKLFSQTDNHYEDPVEEELRMTKICVGDKTLKVMGRVKFSDVQFVLLEKKDYRCYVGHGLHSKDRNIFIAYLFLEKGSITWNNTKELTLVALEGYGMLKIIREEEEEEGKAYSLKPKVSIVCKKGCRLSLKKDGRCKMLKLHLCLVCR